MSSTEANGTIADFVISTGGFVKIMCESIRKLRRDKWMNDKIINFAGKH